MNQAWYDKPATEVIKYPIETPLGTLLVQAEHDGYHVYGEVVGLTVINRITYKLQGSYRLDTHQEEWVGGVYPRRAMAVKDSPDEFRILRDSIPTKAAVKATKVIDDAFREWVNNNFGKLLVSKQSSFQRLIDRAVNRLDAIQAAVDERRAELKRLQQQLNETGGLPTEKSNLLSDLWGHSWRF